VETLIISNFLIPLLTLQPEGGNFNYFKFSNPSTLQPEGGNFNFFKFSNPSTLQPEGGNFK